MNLKKIVAIVRCGLLEKVEKSLQEHGVKGITVSHIKGFGEYADFYERDWLCTHARIELFVNEEEVNAIVGKLLDTANTGLPGDGMIAVLPVDTVYRIKTKQPAKADEI